MWLLDVNMPKKLAAVLDELSIETQTAESRGWNALTNGELVGAAVHAGFTAVLTRDRLFSESSARSLKRFPHFSVVLITIRQLHGLQFLEEFRRAWERSPIRPAPWNCCFLAAGLTSDAIRLRPHPYEFAMYYDI